jgi:hypothetical protein
MMEPKYQSFDTKVTVLDEPGEQLDDRAVCEWKALDLAFTRAERVHRKTHEKIEIETFGC